MALKPVNYRNLLNNIIRLAKNLHFENLKTLYNLQKIIQKGYGRN